MRITAIFLLFFVLIIKNIVEFVLPLLKCHQWMQQIHGQMERKSKYESLMSSGNCYVTAILNKMIFISIYMRKINLKWVSCSCWLFTVCMPMESWHILFRGWTKLSQVIIIRKCLAGTKELFWEMETRLKNATDFLHFLCIPLCQWAVYHCDKIP